MELIEAVLRAIASMDAATLLTAAGVYIATPLLVHIQIQFLKFERRERCAPELGRWTLRAIAFVLCAAIALFIGWRLGRWPLDKAIDHAVNVAVMYPLAMWAYMAYLKDKYPGAYDKLRAPRRRPRDELEDTNWAGKP